MFICVWRELGLLCACKSHSMALRNEYEFMTSAILIFFYISIRIVRARTSRMFSRNKTLGRLTFCCWSSSILGDKNDDRAHDLCVGENLIMVCWKEHKMLPKNKILWIKMVKLDGTQFECTANSVQKKITLIMRWVMAVRHTQTTLHASNWIWRTYDVRLSFGCVRARAQRYTHVGAHVELQTVSSDVASALNKVKWMRMEFI